MASGEHFFQISALGFESHGVDLHTQSGYNVERDPDKYFPN